MASQNARDTACVARERSFGAKAKASSIRARASVREQVEMANAGLVGAGIVFIIGPRADADQVFSVICQSNGAEAVGVIGAITPVAPAVAEIRSLRPPQRRAALRSLPEARSARERR